MSTPEVRSDAPSSIASADTKLEGVVIPVSDVKLAKHFYQSLRWRLNVTPPGVVQLTPHGSGRSVQFSTNLTQAAPGSAKGYLVVSDIEAARDAMVEAGVEVGEIFHIGPDGPVAGPDPEHRSYFSRASLSDTDGNSWLLQEITTRLPGRVDRAATSFGSASDLAGAMRRAAMAYGEHEKRIGEADPNWPAWYPELRAARLDQAALDAGPARARARGPP